MDENTFVIDYGHCYRLVNDRETRLSEGAREIIARQLQNLLFDLYANDGASDASSATCPMDNARHIEYALARTFKDAVRAAYGAMQDAIAGIL